MDETYTAKEINKQEGRAFTPVSFGALELPTRIVRSATEMFIANADGTVNDDEIAIIGRFADEPLGMIITGHTCVSAEGRSVMTQNGIWDDIFMEGQAAIASAIHTGGTRAVMQIGHGGAKADGSNGGLRVLTPDNTTANDIKELVSAFARAAVRARECGFDGVQLHGAHLYLLSQWFYPHLNHRVDAYGGCAANRFRIFREITCAVKAACGDDFPVLLKLNTTAPSDYGEDGGADYFSDVAEAVGLAGECGISAVELSGFAANPSGVPGKPYFIDIAKRLSETCNTPLILVGGVRCAADFETAFDAGASAVSMCRPFIRDPHVIEKIFGGGISDCTYCNGCFRNYNGKSLTRCVR